MVSWYTVAHGRGSVGAAEGAGRPWRVLGAPERNSSWRVRPDIQLSSTSKGEVVIQHVSVQWQCAFLLSLSPGVFTWCIIEIRVAAGKVKWYHTPLECKRGARLPFIGLEPIGG